MSRVRPLTLPLFCVVLSPTGTRFFYAEPVPKIWRSTRCCNDRLNPPKLRQTTGSNSSPATPRQRGQLKPTSLLETRGCSLVTLEPAESLGRGDIDLLITPVHFTSPFHQKLKLLEEDYVCVTWRDSTRFGDTLDLAAYKAAGHVAVSFAGGRTPGLDSALLLESGVERRVEVVAGSLLAPAELVIGTDRVATVQRRLARRVAQHLPLRLWDVPCKLPPLVEYMQWNRVRDADPALKWLISQCLEVAAAI